MARKSQIVASPLFDLNGLSLPKKKEQEKIFSVSQFLTFVNEMLISQRAIVKGEVGRIDNRGHFLFFTLLDKEDEAVLNCFLWQDKLNKLGVELKEGMEITVEGYANVFKRTGRFTFEVERLGLIGEGVLKLALEKLKEQLSQKGFFSPEHKKPILPFPERIGLITSSFADAKTDFLTHLGNFGYIIYFYDVRVEGLYAIEEIVEAIRFFNEQSNNIDVLVLTRGGGSLESLQAFNSLEVAKAVFSSRIPVVTAIGHESDETIADLVADFYASTPTDAARVLSESWRNAAKDVAGFYQNIILLLKGRLINTSEKLTNYQKTYLTSLETIINQRIRTVENLKTLFSLSLKRIFDKIEKINRMFFTNQEKMLSLLSQTAAYLTDVNNSIFREAVRYLQQNKKLMSYMEKQLSLADPTGRLKQGYSIVFDNKGSIVKNAKQTKVGDILSARFYKGKISSKVTKIIS